GPGWRAVRRRGEGPLASGPAGAPGGRRGRVLGVARFLPRLHAAGVPGCASADGQVALFGAQNRDGWGVGLTILTALANLLPMLPEDEAYLALLHGARQVAADCGGAPRRGPGAPGRRAAPPRASRARRA